MSPREALLTADPAAAGERLDRWLAGALPGLSRSRLVKLLENGGVLVDGRPARPSHRMKGGESVRCEIPDAEAAGLEPADIPLDVLHEDDEILVLDKPAGLVVHPGAGAREGTLVHALLHHCGPSLLQVGGARRPGIVHRLDRGTTGVLVVAKTPRAYESLAAQFSGRTVEKTYLAVVAGSPAEEGRVEAPIGRSSRDRTRMAVMAGGRPSLSEWTVVERFGRAAALVRIALHTGRTHQARVHMAHAGHPLVGDAAYRGGGGAPAPWAAGVIARFPRPALHARRLVLDHPATGERMAFEAPVPADLAELVEELRSRAARVLGDGSPAR